MRWCGFGKCIKDETLLEWIFEIFLKISKTRINKINMKMNLTNIL